MRLPRSRGSQFYLVQLVVVAAGLVLLALGSWRSGVAVVGGSFVVGAFARLVVPVEHTGMLRVRGKIFDMMWMILLGVSLVLLALVIPDQPSR
ncbi:DUF3017 domain-containing protein [Aeromicrobium sp. CF3.5]|uniref:DUF3017 domain-containing protein n=1 Tax=Aeromicrobium sp. CF3.5 TaxID=3373078 RepID=UPI003EE4F0A8